MPALDVKVVPGRREPLRHRARLQHEPVRRHAGGDRRARPRRSAPRRSCWRARRSRRRRRACSGTTARSSASGGAADDRRPRALRPRHRRAAARRRGRARRADRLPRLDGRRSAPTTATLTVRTGKGGAAAKAGHNLVIEVTRWQATLDARSAVELTADAALAARALAAAAASRRSATRRRPAIAQTIDEEVLKGGAIAFRSSRVDARDGGLDVEGELELLGVRAPARVRAARSTTATSPAAPRSSRPTGGSSRTRRCSGRSRSPTSSRSRSTRPVAKEHVRWLSSTTPSRPASRPTTTGRRSSTSTGSSRASRAAR